MGPKNISLKMRRASGIHQRPSADRKFPVLLAGKLQQRIDSVNTWFKAAIDIRPLTHA
jgi:hypothetical protein